MLAIVLAVFAALCYAIGWVLQQREASVETERPSLSPALLLHLLGRPLWIVGIVAMVIGNLLQSWALAIGSLTMVEPVLVTSLLFALPLGAAWSRQRLHAREWLAACAVSVGVAALLVFGQPSEVTVPGHPLSWVLTGAATAGAILAVVAFGLRTSGTVRAALFASAAGALFGVQDAATKALFERIEDHGAVTVVTSWQAYAVVATAVYGLLLSQDAYSAAPLPASLPALTVGEPLVGMAVGVGVLGEHFDVSGARPVWELFAVVVMLWGSYALANSPLVIAEQRVDAARRLAEHERAAHSST